MCYWLAILRDYGANLFITGISVDVKRLVKVRVVEEGVLSYVFLYIIKGLLFYVSPFKWYVLRCKSSKGY